MHALIWAGGTVASCLMGLVLTTLAQDKVALMLAKLTRGIEFTGRGRDISGNWYTYYAVIPESTTSPSGATPSGSIEIIHLRKIAKRVFGVTVASSRDYRISGIFQDGKYFTGTWRDSSRGRYHWGGFQLCWLDNGRGMVGKFIGKDSENHVNHGIWLWTRDEADLIKLLHWAGARGGYSFSKESMSKGLRSALARRRLQEGTNSKPN
jgi:hypothetical protein